MANVRSVTTNNGMTSIVGKNAWMSSACTSSFCAANVRALINDLKLNKSNNAKMKCKFKKINL